MKKQVFYQKIGLLTAVATLLLSAQNSLAQFSSTAPGGTAPQFNNAAVGVQVSSITSGVSLDLGNSLSIRGTHLVYNSSSGVIDWGSGGSGNLYFRVLTTQGAFGSGYYNLMTILGSGNVGIGTVSPSVRLHAVGTDGTGRVAIFQNGNYNIAAAANLLSAGYNYITQANDNGIIWSDGAAGGGQNSTSGFVIAPWQNSTNGIRIDGATGNVRMGPWAYVGTAGNAGGAMNWPNAFYGMNMYRNSAGSWVGTTDGAHNGGGLMFSDMGGNVRIASVPCSSTGTANQTLTDAQIYTNVALTITPAEQVIIGSPNLSITTPGSYKLYVAGGILTEQVRVALVNSSTWADYVFSNDYKLKSLNEVEEFVKVNKHLPDVPSASEVKDKGVDVVEMDATLLKKVEELTLYVIELQKQNNVSQAQIQQLQAQLNSLTNKQ